MNLVKNNKLIFYAAAGILILVGVAYADFFMYAKIKSASSEIAEAESKIATLEKRERELNEAISDFKLLEKETVLLQDVFLSENKFVDFVKLLERLANKSKIKATVEGAKLPASTQSKEPASVIMKIEGGFAQIVNFIVLLDKISYSGLVESIIITPQKVSGEGESRTQILQTKINYAIFNLQK